MKRRLSILAVILAVLSIKTLADQAKSKKA